MSTIPTNYSLQCRLLHGAGVASVLFSMLPMSIPAVLCGHGSYRYVWSWQLSGLTCYSMYTVPGVLVYAAASQLPAVRTSMLCASSTKCAERSWHAGPCHVLKFGHMSFTASADLLSPYLAATAPSQSVPVTANDSAYCATLRNNTCFHGEYKELLGAFTGKQMAPSPQKSNTGSQLPGGKAPSIALALILPVAGILKVTVPRRQMLRSTM